MKTIQLAALAAALAAASAPPVSAAANGSPAVPIPAVQAPAIHTGDDLAQLCADPRAAAPTAAEHDRLLTCAGYIRGYLGYYGTLRGLRQTPAFCLPDKGVAAESLRVLYVTGLGKHPQIRDYPAAIDFASVLKAAYPCARTAGRMP
jgi:hypothetical protein